MTPILTLLFNPPYLHLPNLLAGWACWFVLFGLVVWLVVRAREAQRHGQSHEGLFLLLLFLGPLTNLLLGVQLSSGSVLSPELSAGSHSSVLMVFSALPWMLAGGFLGLLEAAIIGAATGFTRSLWDTHNLFTILEPVLLAVLFNLVAHRHFNSSLGKTLRQPLLIALGLVPVFVLFFVLSALFSMDGTLQARFDFSIHNIGPALLAVGGELLLAGLVLQCIAIASPLAWGEPQVLTPFPGEQSLQARFLVAILASTPDPVLVTDQENHLILANPAAKAALGAIAGSAEGQPTEQIINLPELRNLLQELDAGKKSAEVILPDGRVYYATASAVIADGHPVGRVCVMRDVTRFKELDALKSDFVSTVSHDLRSPLTLMQGYGTMLETVGELNEQQKKYVSKILTSVETMTRLVNRLLDLGRIEAGVGLLVDQVAVMDILNGVTDALQLQANQKSIHLGVEVKYDLPQLFEADHTLLRQAVYNLVENAIKYTPENGSITLRVISRPEGLQFEVQDTGIGIPPADLPRLFEKFFRGSQSETRAQRGSGLGLAIVRSIAERHGGRVWVESVIGHGSTFFLLIPFTQPETARNKAERGV